MFKSLANFFRGADWTDEIVESFDTMLALAEQNFNLCARFLLKPDQKDEIRDELYARDREINSREREIRRRIIAHLASRPSEHEIPTAFILTNLVKDAERIGDYVKNLYEVHQFQKETGLDRATYDRYFDGMRTRLRDIFGQVRRAFRESDRDEAQSAITDARQIMRECESAIREIASADHTSAEAVALVLVARHYKRLSAHLVNIATAVVVPADQLDYYDEKNR